MSFTLRTNNQQRPTIQWFELTDAQKADLDWLDTEELQDDFTGFVYKGQVYDLSDFTVLDDENYTVKGWHGVLGESAFSAVVIKISSCNDFVTVGKVFY